MGKVKTNIFELLLKEILINKEFYDDDNKLIKIDDINYSPLLNTVYVKSGDDCYSLSINSEYFFELDDKYGNNHKIKPNKKKLKDNKK